MSHIQIFFMNLHSLTWPWIKDLVPHNHHQLVQQHQQRRQQPQQQQHQSHVLICVLMIWCFVWANVTENIVSPLAPECTMTASTNVIKKFSYPMKYFRTSNKNFENKCLFIGYSKMSFLDSGCNRCCSILFNH